MNTTPRTQGRLAPSDIAAITGAAPSTVSNWRRRHADFPAPVAGTAGRPVFDEAEILKWLEQRGVSVLAPRSRAALVTTLTAELADHMSADTATLLIHQLLAVRYLCEKHGAGLDEFKQATSTDAVAALSWLYAAEGCFAPQDLIPHHVVTSDVAAAVEAIGSLQPTELVDTSETTLKRLNAGRGGGQFGSPGSRVATLLTRAMWIQDSPNSIYDPACGIGETLLEAVKHAPTLSGVHGVEISPWAATIARTRFLLRGINAEILTADALSPETMLPEPTDIVVLEPPLNAQTEASAKWLEHAAQRIAPSGLGLVVTKARALSDKQTARVRQELLKNGAIRGVIQLPGRILQHSSTALALWVLGPSGSAESVALIDGSGEPLPEDHAQGWVDDIDLAGEAAPITTDAFVSIDTEVLLSHGADLTPRRWVTEGQRDPAELLKRFHFAERDAATHYDGPRASLETLPRSHSTTTIGALEAGGKVEIIRGSEEAPRSGSLPDTVIDERLLRGLRAQQHATGSSIRHLPGLVSGTTRPGDVLVAFGDGPAAAVEDHGPHLLTKDLFALRPNSRLFDSRFLALCVEAQWNAQKISGETLAQRIRAIEVPTLSLEGQREWVAGVTELQAYETTLAARLTDIQQLRQAAMNLMAFGKKDTA